MLASSLDGRPLTPGPLPDDARRALRTGAVTIAARVTTGNERPDFAPIVRLMTARGADRADSSEVAAIGERGCDAEMHLRVRANALLLRAPIVTVPRVFPCGGVRDRSRGEPEGDTMVVAGSRVGSELRVTAVEGKLYVLR